MSLDISITLAFGIISTVISLFSVILLNLCAMAIENNLNIRDLENIRIQRLEHTHIVTPRYTRGELEHKPNGWQD